MTATQLAGIEGNRNLNYRLAELPIFLQTPTRDVIGAGGPSDQFIGFAAVLFFVLLSPIILPVHLIRRLVRAIRGTPQPRDTSGPNVVPEEIVPPRTRRRRFAR